MENLKNKVEPISDLKSHNLKREEEIRANTKFLSSMVGAVFSKKSNKKLNSKQIDKEATSENQEQSVEKTENNEKKEKKEKKK